ncbi:MAG: LysR family transcriptional regulator [Pseudomonadota bacterium]
MVQWTELRTATLVARLGTVRAVAVEMGVHRATVTRHVDALEEALTTKLFLRHRDGYSLTEEGKALQDLAVALDRLTKDFVEETRDAARSLSGTLRISSRATSSPALTRVVRRFRRDHPGVTVSLFAENQLSRLEIGEADVALFTGPKPTHDDYVVIPFATVPIGLFGSTAYLHERGVPTKTGDLLHHDFVGIQTVDGAVDVVTLYGIDSDAVQFRTNDPGTAIQAIKSGLGLGIAMKPEMSGEEDVLEVLGQRVPEQATTWLVTHVDLHRTRLLQTFLDYLRPETNLAALPAPDISLDRVG